MSAWAAYASGQPAAGDLIQIPAEGLGMSIPMDNSASTADGALVLNDDDLCGVLSGKLTDFRQLLLGMGSAKPTADTITVSVRFDATNGSLVLTDHLSTVYTMGSGGNSDITFTATSTLFSLPAARCPAISWAR